MVKKVLPVCAKTSPLLLTPPTSTRYLPPRTSACSTSFCPWDEKQGLCPALPCPAGLCALMPSSHTRMARQRQPRCREQFPKGEALIRRRMQPAEPLMAPLYTSEGGSKSRALSSCQASPECSCEPVGGVGSRRM